MSGKMDVIDTVVKSLTQKPEHIWTDALQNKQLVQQLKYETSETHNSRSNGEKEKKATSVF